MASVKKSRRNNKVVPRETKLPTFHRYQARTRVLSPGSEVLSDLELLSLLLPASRTLPPSELAASLLLRFGSLRRLLLAPRSESAAAGLTTNAFVKLQAALELARRHYHEAMLETPLVDSTDSAREYLRMRLRDLPYEFFGVLFLDSQHHVISFATLFRGTLDGSAVHTREVVKEALSVNAAAAILVHNHVAGYRAPSPEDLDVTQRLKDGLGLVDVLVNDHVIIAGAEIISLAELRLL